jgi:hypothetical protein
MPNCEYFQTHSDYKEVIVIGNGPSGLCTSYMLAGNWPYWNKKKVLDEYLQMRLNSLNNENSLIEQVKIRFFLLSITTFLIIYF